MKKKYSTFIIAVLCLISLNAQEIEFKKGSFKNIIKEAEEQNKNIFIDFSASWCGPCKMLEQNVFNSKEVALKYNKEFICYKVMSEDKNFKELARDFKISSFPTLLYISPKNKELYRESGYVDIDRFIKMADLANCNAPSFKELYKQYKDNSDDLKLQQALLLESVYEIKGMINGKEAELWIKRMTDIFYSYFEAKPEKKLVNKTDLNLIRQFHQKTTLKDDVFNHVLKYILDYTEITKDPSVCQYLVDLNNSLINKLAFSANVDYKIPLERIKTDLKYMYEVAPICEGKDAYEILSLLGQAYYSIYNDKDEIKFINLIDKYFTYMGDFSITSDYITMVRALYENIGVKLKQETDLMLIEWFKVANTREPNCDILIFMSDAYNRLNKPDYSKQALNQALMLSLSIKDEYKKQLYQNAIKQKLSAISASN